MLKQNDDYKIQLLRQLPGVDEILKRLNENNCPRYMSVQTVRQVIDDARMEILNGKRNEVSIEDILEKVCKRLDHGTQPGLMRVINATGTILHTNLGRAPMSIETADYIKQVITGYCSLELDLETGKRGDRGTAVNDLIKNLTGAESSVIVNNNAAAVFLAMKALCSDREVIISRGELVEIGGSFRIPEIMEQSGTELREVGTTNRTRLSDYETAINENTAALMKVHTSNYVIKGFTETVKSRELADVAHNHGVIFINDLGSGNMINLSAFGLPKEPTVQESIADGADVITFSGDKLLGGPQAGIIIGKKQFIEKIKQHPLMRALRVDKMTLASLEFVLRLYLEPDRAIERVPVLKAISITGTHIKRKAEQVYNMVLYRTERHDCVEIVNQYSLVGGGALPLAELPTWCLAVSPRKTSCEQMMHYMRQRVIPVIPRVSDEKLFFDMRTVDDSELDELSIAIADEINRAGG